MTGSERQTRRAHAGLAAGTDRIRSLALEDTPLHAADHAVSGWSVGQHVEHLWLAANGICGWIEGSLADPSASPPGGGPTRTGRMVLISGWIPRGKAKAPERTVPAQIVGDDLPARLDGLQALIDRLEPGLAGIHGSVSTFEHPILGHFTPAQWLRFLDVHHRHHEKIMRDIRTS